MAWNPKMGKSPEELAGDLFKIYNEQFGGKDKGRFRTSRQNFRKLANLPVLTEEYIHELSLWLRLKKLVLVDLDHAFCVFPLSSTKSFRRVPDSVLESYLASEE